MIMIIIMMTITIAVYPSYIRLRSVVEYLIVSTVGTKTCTNNFIYILDIFLEVE